MALWEGAFQDTDPLTLSTIIELQLQDSHDLTASAKGKQREGTINDGDVALQMYMEDLMNTNAVLGDRRIAQSMTTAVLLDSRFIQREHELEDQVVRDRQMARSMEEDETPAPINATTKPTTPHEQDAWVDDEFLAKMVAMYMQEPDASSGSTPPPLVYDSDSDGTIAESSGWAAQRNKHQKPKKGHCIACGEDMDFFDVARVPCDHEYCRPCLSRLFELSMTDESLFPPRCDGQEVPLARVRFWLPNDLVKRFESQYAELSTKNKTYCHDPRCNKWIDNVRINLDTDIGTCSACEKTTCTLCKGASHTGDCPDDSALQQLVDTANTEQWQRCYQCKRFVELRTGCNHMSCWCGAQFCYVCGEKWKTCRCDQWEETRLYERAAQIVDRAEVNPGRRLFEPQHAPHSQPASRRQSVASSNAATVAGPATQGARPRRVLRTASSEFESDFTDHSEWEDDWSEHELPDPTARQPSAPPIIQSPASQAASSATRLRDLRIAEAVAHLRTNHECDHDKWRWVKGGHHCEECHHWLREYIFECRQCQLQACNRCRRNRL